MQVVAISLLGVVPFALAVLALFDSATFAPAAWTATSQNRLLWTAVIVFALVLGPLLYLTVARKKLVAATP